MLLISWRYLAGLAQEPALPAVWIWPIYKLGECQYTSSIPRTQASKPMAQDFGLGNLITPKHFVRFYDDDNALVKEITQFIGTGLAAGHGGIVIATPAHVTEIERRLLASGCEIAMA